MLSYTDCLFMFKLHFIKMKSSVYFQAFHVLNKSFYEQPVRAEIELFEITLGGSIKTYQV